MVHVKIDRYFSLFGNGSECFFSPKAVTDSPVKDVCVVCCSDTFAILSSVSCC